MQRSGQNDLDRLRREYARRDSIQSDKDHYSLFNLANLFLYHSRQRQVLCALKREGMQHLGAFRILELGCGRGGVLLEFLGFGANPTHLFGCDLLFERLRSARQILPGLSLVCADGQRLPYRDASFDLALQYTVFSSILDDQVKRNLAAELRRVVRPGGLLLWYDFWTNPTNRQTHGIRPAEIRKLFPGSSIKFKRTTLAPPLARRMVPVSRLLAEGMEKLSVFNTHYLAVMRLP